MLSALTPMEAPILIPPLPIRDSAAGPRTPAAQPMPTSTASCCPSISPAAARCFPSTAMRILSSSLYTCRMPLTWGAGRSTWAYAATCTTASTPKWHNSKFPGVAGRVSVPNFHGFTALFVFSSVAARFYTPQLGGAGAAPASIGVFRIDHDEKFNQTTHLQYQMGKRGPWAGFNWRYDSGLVAGAVPFATDMTTPVDLTGFTADQQMQIGLHCGNVFPTLSSPLASCDPGLLSATRVRIPGPGTEDDDHNPPRIAPRH